LFERDSEFFEKSILVIENAFGNEMMIQSHPYTDVSQLKKKIDVSCINMSCGYYNMHTKEEFISIDDVERAIEAGKNMVFILGLNKHQYEYKPIVYTNKTIMNSLVEEDFDEDIIHQLETIDVEENKDGITILDSLDGNDMFINDDDLVYLYDIIKERLLKKY
jgi:hypothetical protein